MQNKRCVILPGNRSGVRSVNHTTAFVVSASAETGVAAVRRAALGLAIMFLVCGCGRGGTSEAQPEGPARAKTDQDQQQVFNGTIELLVHASGSRLVLHTARGRFEVHTTEATEYKGIAVKCGTALWRLGHRHEIRGRVVPTTARRSTYAHKQSIVASHIKYLGPPP